ncbi:cobalt-zinc-cadmium efflux system outer membrane protein [Sphingobium sp. B2D3A]|uniref:TolC family protein n=1 Tax=unclassified Sphingobium TaxID=2611147 RepID=UPI00222428AB|nr:MULTISPECIES: TolC family protein [unclassified Sphingobium]MCW2338838.1 cobalt-zinc-cadmium efflux system outer membrane protein [Sphingobium sp. B2D3A]MCW2385265.1 cobalt-zinc-cadmium efflux system outer membrane protein [Sphingobium sp. B2D3D]
MKKLLAAMLAAASCASTAQAQQGLVSANAAASILTLEQAIAAAGGAAPSTDAAKAAIEAARANRMVAGLRPNPVAQAQVENVVGTGLYRGLQSAETTMGVTLPIEVGGKRSARVAVATAQLSRAELEAAVVAADVHLQVTSLYVEAIAAERRLATARDQLSIANDALQAARVRVQAGRASPLEEQRADLARINAGVSLERAARLADVARLNLARRLGRSIDGALDIELLDQIPTASYGPTIAPSASGTLTLAAADADLAVADAGIRLARANRVPDLNIGPALRRLEATNDTAAAFAISIAIPLFNNGRAAVAQASAERTRAEARRRMTALDVDQAIAEAQAEAANAETTARAAAGPALAAAQEAARIARIGYREGKFSQLDLLDAERTLADTRVAAIDALANYHNARARLERLTAPAPQGGNRS